MIAAFANLLNYRNIKNKYLNILKFLKNVEMNRIRPMFS